eukprot:5022887-Prymnesium_polylepis.1
MLARKTFAPPSSIVRRTLGRVLVPRSLARNAVEKGRLVCCASRRLFCILHVSVVIARDSNFNEAAEPPLSASRAYQIKQYALCRRPVGLLGARPSPAAAARARLRPASPPPPRRGRGER